MGHQQSTATFRTIIQGGMCGYRMEFRDVGRSWTAIARVIPSTCTGKLHRDDAARILIYQLKDKACPRTDCANANALRQALHVSKPS